MSNHLRHCPKHRKPLPCAHCALVQKPAVVETAAPDPPITAPVEVLPVQPVAKKRGRPPKGGRAMTVTERKQQQRRNADAKQEDSECRDLIAKVLRKLRVGKSAPDEKVLSANSLAEKTANDAVGLHAMVANLKAMSIADLQNFYDSLRSFSDSTGQLPNERSGEKDRKDGQSEVEGLIGQLEYAPARATRSDGHGPDAFDKPKHSADKADTPALQIKLPSDPDALMELRHQAIEQMAASYKCSVCGLLCDTTEVLSQHLNERYETGMAQLERLALLQEFSYGMETQIADTQAKITENRHPLAIQIWMTRLEKERKKEGRLARRLERRGKQAAKVLQAEERERLALQAETEAWGIKDKTKSPGEKRVDPDPPPRTGFS